MDSIWHGAGFITTPFCNPVDICPPWGRKRQRLYQHTDVSFGEGLPLFFKDFNLTAAENTRLLFTALGCCDLYINGKRVGEDELKPGWTDYRKRTLYLDYDISSYVKEGENRLLAVLSAGWYAGRSVGDFYGGNTPAFAACLTQQGKVITVTDESWTAFVGGQILLADIWDGELRDGQNDDFSVISQVGYEPKETVPASLFDYKGEVSPAIGPQVRVRKGLSRKPAAVTVYDGIVYNGTNYGEIHVCRENATLPLTVKKGQTVVIDLAQEIVGWAKIRVKGEGNNLLKIRYAEFLNDSGDITRGNDGAKGSVYTVNLRSALAKGYYILSGSGEETYRPTFTFYGFRYVEITAEKEYELLEFTGEVVGSDTEETGKIETSDKLINQLISNTLWGQRGNYLSVPTDCPQRDERYGWTGDAQAFSTTAAYNADVRGFFAKWLQDARDSQSDEGAYPDVIPRVSCCHSENASAWGDAGVIIPYNLYKMYGEKELLENHYASMEKYIAQLVKNYGLSGPIPRYGDWLAYDWCDNEFISSAYFVHDLDLMEEMSRVLGKTDRADFYKDLRQKAYAYFEEHFMKDGSLTGSTQCEKVIALAFNLLDKDNAEKTAEALVRQIKENDNRLSTGFLGTYNLCPTLSKFGEDKTAYTLLMQRKEPSWLYSIDQGATTIWERWNSYTKENGFGDVGMNSFNHYAYGAVVEWMYRYMAGIEAGKPGFETLILQPRADTRKGDELPDGQLPMQWVKAEYRSVKGLIKSAWNQENGFVYECAVPVDTVLYLPVFGKAVNINGEDHAFSEYEIRQDKAVIRLTPGSYTFIQK